MNRWYADFHENFHDVRLAHLGLTEHLDVEGSDVELSVDWAVGERPEGEPQERYGRSPAGNHPRKKLSF